MSKSVVKIDILLVNVIIWPHAAAVIGIKTAMNTQQMLSQGITGKFHLHFSSQQCSYHNLAH